MPGYTRARGKRKDGSIKWQARWRKPDDPSIRIERTFRSKRDASRWLTTMDTDAYRGAYTDPRMGERLLREVADAWRQTWDGLEPKTRAGYEAILSCG